MCSRPWSVMVAICCTHSDMSVSLLYMGAPSETQYSICCLTSAKQRRKKSLFLTCCLCFCPIFGCFYLLQVACAQLVHLWSCFPAGWPLACATVWIIPSHVQNFVFAELWEISGSSFFQSVKSSQMAALQRIDIFSPVWYHLQNCWLESMLLPGC